jgi:hypothetical protein
MLNKLFEEKYDIEKYPHQDDTYRVIGPGRCGKKNKRT